jgi:hypothetical protein
MGGREIARGKGLGGGVGVGRAGNRDDRDFYGWLWRLVGELFAKKAVVVVWRMRCCECSFSCHYGRQANGSDVESVSYDPSRDGCGTVDSLASLQPRRGCRQRTVVVVVVAAVKKEPEGEKEAPHINRQIYQAEKPVRQRADRWV